MRDGDRYTSRERRNYIARSLSLPLSRRAKGRGAREAGWQMKINRVATVRPPSPPPADAPFEQR